MLSGLTELFISLCGEGSYIIERVWAGGPQASLIAHTIMQFLVAGLGAFRPGLAVHSLIGEEGCGSHII
jgi:hypothetical protein